MFESFSIDLFENFHVPIDVIKMGLIMADVLENKYSNIIAQSTKT